MAPKREIQAIADVLNDPANDDRTAEDMAELVIKALDDQRAATHRLAVVANYCWWPQEDKPTLAVIGPFSTRATGAARAAGEAMAGSVQRGRGKWMLVPAYANARAAWDAIKPPSEAELRQRKFLESIRARNASNPSVWAPLTPPPP